MKTIETFSDAGSIAIGTAECWTLVPNGYGDGTTRTHIFDDWKELEEHADRDDMRGWTLIGSVSGSRIEICDFDCPVRWKPVITLSGHYAIYSNGTRNMALVRIC